MSTEREESNGDYPGGSTGVTGTDTPSEIPNSIEDIFSDDTPLACGLEDVDICESCQ